MRGWDIIDPNTRKIVVASCSGQPGQQLECIRARILWVRGKWEPIRGRLERGGPIRGRHSGPLLGAEEDRKWKCDSWTRKETLRVIQQLLFCPSPASRSSPSLFTRVFRDFKEELPDNLIQFSRFYIDAIYLMMIIHSSSVRRAHALLRLITGKKLLNIILCGHNSV